MIGERKKDEKLLPASWSRGGEEWRRGAEFFFFFDRKGGAELRESDFFFSFFYPNLFYR